MALIKAKNKKGKPNNKDLCLLALKNLEQIYLEAPEEIKDYIYSKVFEIETMVTCGCVIS